MKKLTSYLTTPDPSFRVAREPARAFKPDGGVETPVVNIYPDVTFQTFDGFGGALTESAAVTWQKLPPAVRKEFLRAVFDPKAGLCYTIGRVHLNSCDFSTGNYACVEPGDLALRTFSIRREKQAMVPFALAAQKAAKRDIRLLVSPWSPPGWMKTTGEMNRGGKLLPECARAWAGCYVRFIQAMEAEGLHIGMVSVQNEPKATQSWDSCVYTGEEERDFVRDHLGPALKKAGLLPRVELYVWDHNRERLYERAAVVLDDPKAAKYVAGAAFHWYSGDHFDALSLVSRRFPKAKLLFSEGCVELHSASRADSWSQGERYAHHLLGDLSHGATGWLDWNVLLDEIGGPNHVGNYCNAPIIADTKAGKLVYQNAFYFISHFSRFIRPNAVRVGSTSFSSDLETVAFRNEDGSVVLVTLNRTDKDMRFVVRDNGLAVPLTLPAHSIRTSVIS